MALCVVLLAAAALACSAPAATPDSSPTPEASPGPTIPAMPTTEWSPRPTRIPTPIAVPTPTISLEAAIAELPSCDLYSAAERAGRSSSASTQGVCYYSEDGELGIYDLRTSQEVSVDYYRANYGAYPPALIPPTPTPIPPPPDWLTDAVPPCQEAPTREEWEQVNPGCCIHYTELGWWHLRPGFGQSSSWNPNSLRSFCGIEIEPTLDPHRLR